MIRRRTCIAFGGALAAILLGIIGYLFGKLIVPLTDLGKAFGDADGSAAMFGWLGLVAGGAGGARLGASYYRERRKQRQTQARRERYAEVIAQHEAEKASSTTDDGWDDRDRMPLKWKGDKADDFESPWP